MRKQFIFDKSNLIQTRFPLQRTTADMTLKETLRSISNHRDYDDEPLPVYLVSDKPMAHIMKSVLKAAERPKNLFDKSVLISRFQRFAAGLGESEEMLFEIKDLFDEGWLIDCNEEWMHNCRPKKYEGLMFADSSREQQILKFLITLSDIEVYDVGLTFDPDKNKELLESLNTSVDELVKNGILYVDDEITNVLDPNSTVVKSESEDGHRSLYISSHTNIWNSLGSIVLSSLLDEWLAEGYDVNRYGEWLNYCRFLKYAWTPERYVEDKESLYNYCLKLIKALNSDDHKELQKLNKALWLSSNSKQAITIPANPRLREEYFGQRVDYFHELQFISYFSHTIVGTAVDMCCRLYNHVPMNVRKGLIDVLANPYFSILNHYNGYLKNPDLSVDAIKWDNLCYKSLITIYGELQRKATDRTRNIYAVEKFADELWDVIYNNLSTERVDTSRDVAIVTLVEFLIYLGQSCDFGEGSVQNGKGRNVFGYNKTALIFFSIMLEKYTDELGEYEQVDNIVQGYIVERLNAAEDDEAVSRYMDINRYMRMIFAFTARKKKDSFFYDKWFKCSLEELEKLYKRSIESHYNISSIPLNVIEDLFKESDESLIDAAKSVIEAGDSSNSSSEVSYIDKGNREWGRCIALYFLALEINKNESSNVAQTAKGSSKNLKDFYINSLTSFQKGDGIFSREKIRSYDDEDLFKLCISVIDRLDIREKEMFILKACGDDDIASFEKIDLIRWAYYISENDIKGRLLKSATKGVDEEAAKRIAKRIYEPAIIAEDFSTVASLVIWYKEEFISGNDGTVDEESATASGVRGEKQVRKSTDSVITGCINIAEALVNRYREWVNQPISSRGEVKNNALKWVESAEAQIYFLKGETEELRHSQNIFYTGLAYLESDKEEDTEKAVKIFSELYKTTGNIPSGINLMSALAQTIRFRIGDETNGGSEFADLILQIKKVYEEIKARIDNGEYRQDNGLYYSMLLAYLLVGNYESFWYIYSDVPKDDVLDPNITELAVRVYVQENETARAYDLYENCKAKYGSGNKLKVIKEIIDAKGKMPLVSVVPYTEMDETQRPSFKVIREVLDYLRVEASGDEIMRAVCGNDPDADVRHDLLEQLGINPSKRGDERLLILEMLLSAATELEGYARSLLWDWSEVEDSSQSSDVDDGGTKKKSQEFYKRLLVPDENTFNRTIKVFLNRREWRFLGYMAVDQTESGKPEKLNGFHTGGVEDFINVEDVRVIGDSRTIKLKKPAIGEIDLNILRDEDSICVVEGIKLLDKIGNNGGRRDNVISHISKLFDYDTKKANLYCMMVYSGGADFLEICSQYVGVLNGLKEGNDKGDNRGCYVCEVIPDIDPQSLGVKIRNSRMCITIHKHPKNPTGKKIIMYHIFVDVLK